MKFNLDFSESMSLVRVMACAPWTPYFFVSACLDTFKKHRREIKRGFAFGHHIGSMIVKMSNRYSKKLNPANANVPSTPGVCRRKYHEAYLSDYNIFKKEVTEMCFHSLSLWLDNSECPPNKKSKKAIYYKSYHEKMKGCVPKCGSLGGNQILIPISIIGLGPLWICNKCTIDPTSHALKCMCAELGFPTGREAGDQLVESIVSGMETKLNCKFSLRNAKT